MTDRDITDLAREVLDDERAWAALDPGHHPESQAAVYRLANAAPTLARAVIRVEALADRLDREASEYLGRPVHSQAGDRIRAALNGDNHE
ncbi:hypothetical protein M3C81_000655 [Micrococcus luteus]|nr:hypothetical protein [Micrococcus luteus]